MYLDGRNPFFEAMPHWFLLPGILIATCASIIAAQALITGAYTLINEAMNLNFWQRVSVKQPTENKGQIYVPSVNTILWGCCMAMAIYFRTSEQMQGVYGLAITVAMLVTTYLLAFFLIYKLKWNRWLVFAMLLFIVAIDLSFFIANLPKLLTGAYISVIVGMIFFLIMYVSFFGRKVHNKYIKFLQLDGYTDKLFELSEDTSIPKFTTHLVYLTKADSKYEIEEKIINSIFDKQPKRADVYWFFHINRTNSPSTLDYDVVELKKGCVMKINLNVGFKIRPRAELYFKHIINELVKSGELHLDLKYNGSTKYNPGIDFKFVIIERFLSVENEFSFREGIILKSYFVLKNISLNDQEAFGIDKSDAVVEHIPLIHHPVEDVKLKRLIK